LPRKRALVEEIGTAYPFAPFTGRRWPAGRMRGRLNTSPRLPQTQETTVTDMPARPALLTRLRPRGAAGLPAPAVLLLLLALAYPLAIVVLRSVTDPAPGLDNYVWFFQSAVNRTVLQRTFVVAAWVTLVSLVCAYPYAYAMTIVGRNVRLALI